MPLIACPECERPNVSSLAPSCPGCGAPIAQLALATHGTEPFRATPPVSATPPAPVRTGFECPKCRSPETKKLSAVWRDGYYSTSATTGGVGVGSGGSIGVGAAKTNGTSQNLSSAGASPPEKQTYAGGIFGAIVGGLAALIALTGGAIVFGLIAGVFAVACGFAAAGAMKYNDEDYPRERNTWERTFQCGRCEHRFIPSAP